MTLFCVLLLGALSVHQHAPPSDMTTYLQNQIGFSQPELPGRWVDSGPNVLFRGPRPWANCVAVGWRSAPDQAGRGYQFLSDRG